MVVLRWMWMRALACRSVHVECKFFAVDAFEFIIILYRIYFALEYRANGRSSGLDDERQYSSTQFKWMNRKNINEKKNGVLSPVFGLELWCIQHEYEWVHEWKMEANENEQQPRATTTKNKHAKIKLLSPIRLIKSSQFLTYNFFLLRCADSKVSLYFHKNSGEYTFSR